MQDSAPKAFLEEDEFLEFLYKPHTLLGLALTVAFLGYLSLGRGQATEANNERTGLIGCAVAFLLYCALQLRDGLLIRPHPVFWRMVNGTAIIYLMLLIFISMQDVTYVRTVFLPKVFDTSLGTIPESNTKIYAEDCRLYTLEDPAKGWANIKDAVFDIFMVAHSVGWWAKAVLFRDYWLLWVLSFSWEVLEVSFQHLLPNFKECWWDHYLLDVFGCNLAGMLVGMWTCKYFRNRTYNWTGVRKIPTTKGKVQRLIGQFTPFSWTSYEWAALSSVKRLLQVGGILLFVELTELNAFMLKHAMWVPPPCYLNLCRLFIIGMLSFPALREYYSYIDNPECRRMGASLWLMCAIGAVETIAVFKFSRQDPHMFVYPAGMKPPVPATALVINAWIATGVMFVTWVVLHFGLPSMRTQHKWFAWGTEALAVASTLPLVYLAAVDFWDTWTH